MLKVSREAWVPYTPEQMYKLVNDVEQYPHFLPWCKFTEILSATSQAMQAKVHVVQGGLNQSFTTENHLEENKSIKMTLVDGPFSFLEGIWTFEPQSGACKVNFNLEFEFASRLLNLTIGPFFHKATNAMIDAFTKRAEAVYGK